MNVSGALVDYLLSIRHLNARSQRSYQQGLTVFAEWCQEHTVVLEKVNNKHVQSFLRMAENDPQAT